MATNSDVLDIWDNVAASEKVEKEASSRVPQDNASSKASSHDQQTPGTSAIKLVIIIENLILSGMTSLSVWDKVMSSMRTDPEIVSVADCVSFYWVLKNIYNSFSIKVYARKDVDQEKPCMIHDNIMTYDEIMAIMNPILKKKTLKDRSFSSECVQRILKSVRKIVQMSDKNCLQNKDENPKRKLSNSPKKASPKKRVKLDKVVEPSDSSSSSSGSSDESSTSSSDECSSSSDSEDEFDQIFKQKKLTKSKSINLKQIFQFKKHKNIRKITTPGEHGKYLIKIEITETKDLRSCSDPSTYWTKVSKKLVFLCNKNDDKYKTISNTVKEVGKELAEIQGVTNEKKKAGKIRKWKKK